MSRTAAGLALGILLVVILVATAPARLLGAFVPADRVILQGYAGTVWHGSANRALVAAGKGYIHLGQLTWSLSPWSLLGLSPVIAVESNWGKQKLNAEVRITGEQSIELSNLDALFSVQLIRQFLPLAVEGDISAQFDEFQLHEGFPTRAMGRVVWQRAAWQSAQGIAPLGTYALNILTDSSGAIQGEVITVTGEVDANGTVELKGNNYSIDILVGSKSGLNDQLKQALSLIAQPRPEGYRVAFDGKLITQ